MVLLKKIHILFIINEKCYANNVILAFVFMYTTKRIILYLYRNHFFTLLNNTSWLNNSTKQC